MFTEYNGQEKGVVIVCAAARDEMSDIVLCGVRHGDDCMVALLEDMLSFTSDCYDFDTQGFVDNKGNFLTREEAWTVAYDAGQIRYICPAQTKERTGNRLYSENLY